MKQIRIPYGLNLRLAGAPDLTSAPEKKTVQHVALVGSDYVGMKPTLFVEVGDRVLAGQRLFADKKNPGVQFVSPCSGVVEAVQRAEKRAFRSLVIRVDDDPTDARRSVSFPSFTSRELDALQPMKAREILISSGLWVALRARPFSRVAKVDGVPSSLFVNVADANPHAPAPKSIVDARQEEFLAGLRVLSKICGKRLWVCFGKGDYAPDFIEKIKAIPNAEPVQFLGRWLSGLTGTHIGKLDPCGLNKIVWSLGYQDAIAIGELFTTGRYPTDRVVSLSGTPFRKPRLLQVFQGSSVSELVDGELKNESINDKNVRVVSGSLIYGRKIEPDQDGLGRYVNQISAVSTHVPRELFGWTTPGFRKFSTSRTFASLWLPRFPFKTTTALHGGVRAVFPNPNFERFTALDLEPMFLFKALEAGDVDMSEKLGAFELDEEDLALCTLVDFGKNDYGKSLRALLDKAMKEET